MPFLFVLGLGGFISAFTLRIAEPMVPLLAIGFSVDVHTVAYLSSAFTLPYALGQPFLGPYGDAKGKERVILWCLALLALTLIISAFSPNYTVMVICRVLSGLAAGGVIPLSLAVIGDRFPLEQRQIAISRYMVAVVTGQIFGAPVAGVISDYFGWQPVFIICAALIILVANIFHFSLRKLKAKPSKPLNISSARANYVQILSNPKAAICFSTVFIEGLCIFGIFPYIAVRLQDLGIGGVREAGFVIGGIGLGGALFSLLAAPLLKRFGRRDVMAIGGLLLFIAFTVNGFSSSWQMQMAAFTIVGVGFYMLHSALQTEATELSPTARGSAVALHAFFFFLGQALGPFFYSFSLSSFGIITSSILAAIMIFIAANLSRILLNRVDARA